MKILEEWKKLKKLDGSQRPNSSKLDAFQVKLDKPFDIKMKGAETAIQNDPTLSPRRKFEDLAFLEDQLSGKGISYMGKLDDRKAKLEERKARRLEEA